MRFDFHAVFVSRPHGNWQAVSYIRRDSIRLVFIYLLLLQTYFALFLNVVFLFLFQVVQQTRLLVTTLSIAHDDRFTKDRSNT